IKQHGHRGAAYAESFPAALRMLTTILREGDLLLTLGAGDVWKLGEDWLEQSKR
ncbi:MAG: UDP-N-acetylmuramate--alanine ligase, partial [Bacteroidetes bacterium]|nr:UDP-N-acetylmuramate--alanine ligase [Bacteroidota bacterium]